MYLLLYFISVAIVNEGVNGHVEINLSELMIYNIFGSCADLSVHSSCKYHCILKDQLQFCSVIIIVWKIEEDDQVLHHGEISEDIERLF